MSPLRREFLAKREKVETPAVWNVSKLLIFTKVSLSPTPLINLLPATNRLFLLSLKKTRLKGRQLDQVSKKGFRLCSPARTISISSAGSTSYTNLKDNLLTSSQATSPLRGPAPLLSPPLLLLSFRLKPH